MQTKRRRKRNQSEQSKDQLLLALFEDVSGWQNSEVTVAALEEALGDEDVSQHGGLLGNMVRRYENRGVDREDLMQAGYMGLQKAAKRFDRKRGVKFITFGKFAAKREMVRALLRHFRWENRHVLESDHEDHSDEGSFQSILESQPDTSPDPSAVAERNDMLELARKRLAQLSRREMAFCYLHYWEQKSLGDIAAEKGVSRSYVHKVVSGAIKKLRAIMQEAGDLR